MLGVSRIGIMKTEKTGAATVDAAEVNPFSPAKKITAKKPVRK